MTDYEPFNPRIKNITLEQHIGNRLLLIRKAKDMSLGDIAKIIGVSYQQMQKYEKGTNRMSASTLYELAKYFKVDPDFFFNDYKGDPSSATNSKPLITVEGVKIMNEVNKIHDPKMRKKVIQHLVPMAKAFHCYFHDEAIQKLCKTMLENKNQD